MSQDFTQFELDPQHPYPDPYDGSRLDGIDPSFVFDFTAYDDLDDSTQRWSTWLERRAALPRPGAPPRLGGDLPGRRRHRARHPQDRQGGRRLPRRAGRPGRPRRRRRDGGQALPQQRAPQLPPGGDLHRGPQHQALPRRARPQAQEHLGQGRRVRRVGGLGVGRAQAVLGARAAGPLPGADRRHRDPDGVDHRRRRHRAAAGPDPAGPGAAGVVLRAAARRPGRDGAARRRPRRPVGVQPPRRRATGS